MNGIWDLTTPYGGPRYYPPGQHPAVARQRALLLRLESLRADTARRRATLGVWIDSRELDDSITEVRQMLADFEAHESECKARDAAILSDVIRRGEIG
jgi:hypothetical protein